MHLGGRCEDLGRNTLSTLNGDRVTSRTASGWKRNNSITHVSPRIRAGEAASGPSCMHAPSGRSAPQGILGFSLPATAASSTSSTLLHVVLKRYECCMCPVFSDVY